MQTRAAEATAIREGRRPTSGAFVLVGRPDVERASSEIILMAGGRPTVSGVLAAASRARLIHGLDLGFGRSAAVWRNDRDRVVYDQPEGHTLSLYLEGGTGTRRLDGRPLAGWPGALSIMPHGRCSAWGITAPFAFVHLYMPAGEMARAFAETFERDARLFELAEVTFADAPRPAAALHGMALATAAGDALAAEAAMTEAVALVLGDPRWAGFQARALKGGLAPHLGRRVGDYVAAHLHETIRLADLAGMAGLSAFHFQRAFRASAGISPQAFVAHRRIERAKSLLRRQAPIAEVALACGYSGQSHLTRAFKAATGTTPGVYRACS